MKAHILLALVGLATGLITPAFTQTIPKELVGTWTIVSIMLEKDGKKTDLFGPNPQGRLIRDAEGHVGFMVTRADLPNSHPTIAQQERQRKTRPSSREASSTSVGLL